MYQLSFVFQGKVDFDNECSEIVRNIQRVRVLYPLSEIILSTWSLGSERENRLLEKLKYLDVNVIFSVDPGPLVYREGSYQWVSNINRMINSTKRGVEAATREYVVKLRTDSYFINRNINKIFLHKSIINNRFDREKKFSLFSERIINCNLFARHSRSYRPFNYHPGDIMMLGKKEDVLNFFSSPDADENLFEIIFNKTIFSLMRLVPEQYLWVNYIKNRVHDFNYLGNNARGMELTSSSERYYINNFIPFSSEQLGFVWPKYSDKYHNKGRGSIYQFSDWVKINNQFYNNKKRVYGYRFFYKVVCLKTIYFFFYLPLRWGTLRRIIMQLKSRE
ncbi:hypothetical protein HGT71_08805 [Rosenbergiella epipactidis]|uniref:WavE lipopolysaccharide synthesis family protein n=1 Tax=Rosenbergiella epipactidis TaxID=1544694 RepID=UPI001BDAE354|nr:WavE lipopolysaccharide synthesis family protein [Rosenbergiella epipactidis]MBT0718358.1 hypothetical protein [Rosenbergiella epipactidis]